MSCVDFPDAEAASSPFDRFFPAHIPCSTPSVHSLSTQFMFASSHFENSSRNFPICCRAPIEEAGLLSFVLPKPSGDARGRCAALHNTVAIAAHLHRISFKSCCPSVSAFAAIDAISEIVLSYHIFPSPSPFSLSLLPCQLFRACGK
jgi:hypothetical protein